MRFATALAATTLAATLAASFAAHAYEADWKRGRIYYRSVCTSCHAASPVGSIAPSSKPKAEWVAYIQADKHAKGKETVRQYIGIGYRARIKSGNKAAEKFADVPEQDLLEDVKAFLIKGAKDGDAPASCS